MKNNNEFQSAHCLSIIILVVSSVVNRITVMAVSLLHCLKIIFSNSISTCTNNLKWKLEIYILFDDSILFSLEELR